MKHGDLNPGPHWIETCLKLTDLTIFWHEIQKVPFLRVSTHFAADVFFSVTQDTKRQWGLGPTLLHQKSRAPTYEYVDLVPGLVR